MPIIEEIFKMCLSQFFTAAHQFRKLKCNLEGCRKSFDFQIFYSDGDFEPQPFSKKAKNVDDIEVSI